MAIEAIARSRYPNMRIKEIQQGFYTDEINYIWIVALETDKLFENTINTVDTNDIRAWYEQQKREE